MTASHQSVVDAVTYDAMQPSVVIPYKVYIELGREAIQVANEVITVSTLFTAHYVLLSVLYDTRCALLML